MLKTGQCRPTGERLFITGRDIGQRLKQRIATEIIRVVEVEVASQNLVDALHQDLPAIVCNKLLLA